ncbi:uncharacterized protein LOC110729871 [Chenopodium quinoa]|uniref:Uncharacterized protein n=1 Tax=Chenopodium quinoa TaxID=63459 RepID=A0A803MLW2_CHEQI|nr:uncharacterized protein LOC110729871 [Chenopodium quinoa]
MAKTDGDSKKKLARRKPLRDVSNGGIKSIKSSLKKTKLKMAEELPPHYQNQQSNIADPLDRLLLVHSDISSLLRQIDEIVVQAVKVDTTDNERITEIKSFTTVLSEIHYSLKPWVPRLQKAIDVPHTESEIQFCETRVEGPVVDDQGDVHEVGTPEPAKFESLVSPSPLVSWRATGCVEERGKQLFFLTPLLRPQTTTSKARASTKLTVCEGISSSVTAAIFSSPCANEKSKKEKVEVVSENLESISDMRILSAQEIPVSDLSTSLITPCPKNPPVRAYVEPGHELTYRKIVKSHKSTPFPTGNQKIFESTDSESSSNEAQEKLGIRYLDLIGIKPSCKSAYGNRALDASPAWITSPPKCCTLLEPLDEKQSKHHASLQEVATTFNQKLCLDPKESRTNGHNQEEENKKFCLKGNTRSNFATVESTPLWKGSESTIYRGKRPGENTLKKELWTRFEAASTNGLNFPVSNDTSHKGFMEMLEEASCDESNVHPDAFR